MSTAPTRDELDAMFKPLIIWAFAYNANFPNNPVDYRDFMFMGNDGDVSMYKHGFTRRYLHIGTDGPLSWSNGTYVPVADVLALVKAVYEP